MIRLKTVKHSEIHCQTSIQISYLLDVETTEDNLADIAGECQQHRDCKAKIEPRYSDRRTIKEELNWVSEYSKKIRNERIVWKTKLFKENKKFHEKSILEQTEELTDLSVKRFVSWIKQEYNISSITEEFVKQLFSIGVQGDAS